MCEHVAEAAGLPKEIENLILAKIQQQIRNIAVFEQNTLEDLADATNGIVHHALKVNNIKFTKNEDIPNLFHCTDERGESFDVSVDNLIETALKLVDTRYRFVSEVVPHIKEQLKHVNPTKKADLDALADATKGILYYTLNEKKIKPTEDTDIPNLFHCTDEDGESFDVSVANLIKIALEAPDDIKSDIVERIKQRAMGKRLAQPLAFDKFVEDSKAAAYLALCYSEGLTFVPDQNDKFLFHCDRNGTKFNVDVAKLIEEALKK